MVAPYLLEECKSEFQALSMESLEGVARRELFSRECLLLLTIYG